MQWRDCHSFTAIKADQRSIDQLAHLHHLGQCVDVDSRALPDLRSGGRREHGLDIDALGRELQSQPLREKQHKCFGSTVDRHAEFRCQPNYGADIDDRAFTRLRKPRSDRAGEPDERGCVERDESSNIVGRLLDEAARLSCPGIVDEDPDPGVFAQARFDSGKVVGLCEIRLEDIDCDAVLLAQVSRQCLQARLVAGDQYEVVAATCEALGVGGANARGSAGNKDF